MDESPPDLLDQAIAEKRAMKAEMVRDLEIVDIELRTLEKAASLRPLKLNGVHHRMPREATPERAAGAGRGGG